MRYLIVVVVLLIALLASGWVFGYLFGCTQSTLFFERCPANVKGLAIKAVDGDGLYLEGFDLQIRLWGVLAPKPNEDGGKIATERLSSLIRNEEINCTKEGFNPATSDYYARYVGHCTLSDGSDLNAAMLEAVNDGPGRALRFPVLEDCEITNHALGGMCR